MQIQLLGINHKTAPLNVREKFVFSGDIVTQALIDFKNEVASEVLILSTCNRTEIYFNNSKKEKLSNGSLSFMDLNYQKSNNIFTIMINMKLSSMHVE